MQASLKRQSTQTSHRSEHFYDYGIETGEVTGESFLRLNLQRTIRQIGILSIEAVEKLLSLPDQTVKEWDTAHLSSCMEQALSNRGRAPKFEDVNPFKMNFVTLQA